MRWSIQFNIFWVFLKKSLKIMQKKTALVQELFHL